MTIAVRMITVSLGKPADPKLQAVGQLCSTASMPHNLQQCRALVKKAVAAGAKVRVRIVDSALVLPAAGWSE